MKKELMVKHRKLSIKTKELSRQVKNYQEALDILLKDLVLLGPDMEASIKDQFVRVAKKKSRIELKLVKLTYEKNMIKAGMSKSDYIDHISLDTKISRFNESLKRIPLEDNLYMQYVHIEGKPKLTFYEQYI